MDKQKIENQKKNIQKDKPNPSKDTKTSKDDELKYKLLFKQDDDKKAGD